MENEYQYQSAIEAAEQAGLEAVAKTQVVPMVVSQLSNPLDDNSEPVQQWMVPDGVCGFAWVTVKPATSKFARWLKKHFPNDWRPAYQGGLQLWIHQFNQSMTKKEAYADAYASKLREHGFKAYAGSRMD